MPAIHKEPFITPEMIAAWNNAASGGGGDIFNNPTLLHEQVFKITDNDYTHDTTYNRYTKTVNISSAINSTITNADLLYIQYFLGGTKSFGGQAGNLYFADIIDMKYWRNHRVGTTDGSYYYISKIAMVPTYGSKSYATVVYQGRFVTAASSFVMLWGDDLYDALHTAQADNEWGLTIRIFKLK